MSVPRKFTIVALFLSMQPIFASNVVENPWFIGGLLGFGSTTWSGLVPPPASQNSAMAMATPVYAEEGGLLWGVAGGVEAFQNFQLQFDYMHYPNANVYFDSFSIFSENTGSTQLTSSTYTWSVQGKFLVPWQDTNLRFFAAGGAAWLSRRDELLEQDLVTPTFGLGLNYGFTPHLMGEVAFSYTAGNGQSELSPADHYMPFLYGVFARVFLRMG